MKPIYSYDEGPVSVRSYGKALRFDPENHDLSEPISTIEAIATEEGIKNVLWQRLANDNTPKGRFEVEWWDNLPYSASRICTVNNSRLDGVLLTWPGQSVAFATRDCPTLILHEGPGKPIAVLHCSRSSLQGFDISFDHKGSVIRNALQECERCWFYTEWLKGVITLGISKEHFRNDRYPNILRELREEWPRSVDGIKNTIDLVGLIRSQLFRLGGISTSQVKWDGFDTFSNPELASHRRGHDGYHNLVMVSYV